MNYMVEEKKEETPREKATEVKEKAKAEAKKEVKEAKKEEKEKKVEVPKKFKKLVEEIESLSVLDLAELVKILEKKFGVPPQAPVVAAPAVPAPAGAPTAPTAPAAEEKTVFNIELKEVGEKKIEVIKAVRDITQKGLKEAKDLVDAAATSPQVVKENVKKEEAEELKKKLETAGAKVELK